MILSEDERYIISEGIIALMDNANAAKALVHDLEVVEATDKYLAKLQALNQKICTEQEVH